MEGKRVKIFSDDRQAIALSTEDPLTGPIKIIEARETRYENRRIKSREFGYVDEEGNFIPHGTKTLWDEKGQKSFEEEFLDGKPHGIFREWHDNGQLHTEETYKDGKLSGVSKEWNENGVLILRAEYEGGHLEGVFREYGPEGNLKGEEQYKVDQKHGRSLRFYDDGAVLVEMNYAGGKLDGASRMFFPDGRVLETTIFADGKIVSQQIDPKFARLLDKLNSESRTRRG